MDGPRPGGVEDALGALEDGRQFGRAQQGVGKGGEARHQVALARQFVQPAFASAISWVLLTLEITSIGTESA